MKRLICIAGLVAFVFLSLSVYGSGIFSYKRPQDIVIEKDDNLFSGCTLLRLYTPREEKEQYRSDEPLLTLEVGTYNLTLPIRKTRRILFKGIETLTFVSDAATVCYSLGEGDFKLPEPPSWYKDIGKNLRWEPCRLAKPSIKWYYIPSAAWVWGGTPWYEPKDELLLFRKDFSLSENFYIVRATLHVTASDTLERIYCNGENLLEAPQKIEGRLLSWDITSLVCSDDNILGIKIARKKSGDVAFSGVAFRIEVEGFNVPEMKSDYSPPFVRAVFENGDVITGQITNIDPPEVSFETMYGKISADLDWISRIDFNFPEVRTRKKSTFKQITSQVRLRRNVLGTYKNLEAESRAWPLNRQRSDSKGILLKNGDIIPGNVVEIEAGFLKVKPKFGGSLAVPLHEVEVLYPNSLDDKRYLSYTSKDLISRCRVMTVNGDRISGMLDRLTPSDLILTPVFSDSLKIETHNLAWVDFPAQPLIALKNTTQKRKELNNSYIGLIGNLKEDAHLKGSVYFEVNRALFDAGLKTKWISPFEMVSQNIFNHNNFPILINMDQNESYFHSVNVSNDAVQALADYKKSGGNIVQMAAGTPNFYGYISHQGKWIMVRDSTVVNRLLNMEIASPANKQPDGIPFELPDNSNASLFFELAPEHENKVNLPRHVHFPFCDDTRFRPLSAASRTEDATITPLYYLKDTRGRTYGIASALITYQTKDTTQEGYGFYACYPLLKASHNSTSMVDYLLGYLIGHILETDDAR